MWLLQWNSKKSGKQTPPSVVLPVRTGRDPNPALKKKPNTGKASTGHVQREPKLGPRGRTLSHPPPASHKSSTATPNPSKRPRQSLTPVSPTTHSRSMSTPVAPGLLDDPAFSSNPRSNPHFSTSRRGTRPPSHSGNSQLHTLVEQEDSVPEFQLKQPPNTPQDSPTDYYGSSKSPFVPSATISVSASSVPSLSSTASTNSHTSTTSSSPQTPPSFTNLPTPAPTTYRPTSPRPPPPPYELPQSDTPKTPVLGRNNTAPDFHQSIERPVLPSRPVTTPTDLRMRNDGPEYTRRTIFNRGPQRPQELDRIDELDETDPLGMPWHHGGPYEAITRVIAHGTKPETVMGYDGQMHRSNKVTRHIRNGVVGISLNLLPGQILPRSSDYVPQSLVPSHSFSQSPPQAYNLDNRVVGRTRDQQQTHYFPHHLLPLTRPQQPKPTYHDPYALPSHQAVNVQHQPQAPHPPAAYFDPNRIQRVDDPEQLQQPRDELSPDAHHRTLEDDRHNISQGHNSHQRPEFSSDPVHVQQQVIDRIHSSLNGPQSSQRAVAFDLPTHVQPPLSSNRDRRSLDALNPSHVNRRLQRPDRDRRSLQVTAGASSDPERPSTSADIRRGDAPSVQASVRSHSLASTRARSDGPLPHYLPKHLVMPMPLQPDLQRQHPPHRPSLSGSTHPDPYLSHDKPRAQDIPTPLESRKLVRRRTAAPNRGSALPAPTMLAGRGAEVAERPVWLKDQVPKRVLSKRRNDL